VTGAADVWGIGAVLYAALTGRAPFPAVQDGPRYPQLTRRADGIGEHRPLPERFAELEAIVAACLAPEARARPGVDELADRLDWLLDDEPGDPAGH
jgi:serine/threonine protein kinase